MSMILGMCFGGMVTLAGICSDLCHRIEVLERDNRKLKWDIEKLIENN